MNYQTRRMKTTRRGVHFSRFARLHFFSFLLPEKRVPSLGKNPGAGKFFRAHSRFEDDSTSQNSENLRPKKMELEKMNAVVSCVLKLRTVILQRCDSIFRYLKLRFLGPERNPGIRSRMLSFSARSLIVYPVRLSRSTVSHWHRLSLRSWAPKAQLKRFGL